MKLVHVTAVGFILAASMSSAVNQSTYQQALRSVTAGEVSIESIKDTPIAGMKELTVNTGKTLEIIYISADGNYIFNGSLFDVKNRVDITASHKNGLRSQQLLKFSDSDRINFFPDNMTDKVTVFTDLDCPYCRQMHQQMADYNELGIGISYLFFPRTGLNTDSAQKAVYAWCAENPKKALNKAMAGEQLPEIQCDNPVADHYNAGIAVGVSGTPALILEDGTMLPGLIPPQQLKQRLDRINKSPQP
ncbi:MAG: thioredoxin fold domain-containing protein [Proteobacteria bacterium]|nr:thioredoxin fold domain-containing protein [Pseudomonadota bacterium]